MIAKETMDEAVDVSGGRIEGMRLSDVGAVAWLGIPYAKPPVDQLRWKAPREVDAWTGVLQVRDFQNSSVQVIQGVPSGSEDCLYLNIWRPHHAEKDLPVFVFLHGGGNIAGSGRDFQGGLLARETNSIVITVNYRLGAMGFYRHPALRTGDPLDDSGNYGLLDILHALKWIRKNIISFGGNPDNVTLAGQSAGARNALAAYLSPLGKGLFHKLFIMSGGFTTATSEQGEAKANDILAALLLNTGAKQNLDEAYSWISSQADRAISDYLYSQNAIHFAEAIGDTGLRMNAFPHLFEDGAVIPIGGFENLNNRDFLRLPTVLGSTASEFSGFALSDPHFISYLQNGQLFENGEHRLLYEAAVQYGSELYAAFNVEQVSEKFTALFPEFPLFGYRFRWGLLEGVIDPAHRFLMGAPHGADIPFYTGDFSAVQQNSPPGVISEHNESGRNELSSLMRGYLRQFIHTGDPNGEGLPVWQRWTTIPHSDDIITLDASEEKAVIQMGPKLVAKDILSRMEEDARLSVEQRIWLEAYLFSGRFFWKDA